MISRVAECIYPEARNCRGCSYSYDPSLFDGGCKLHYGKTPEGAGKSPAESKAENGGELHADFSEIQKGNR